jgi:uncharacterized protein (TIGR00375 family)
MKLIADLHIHGRYSRGCSTDLTIGSLEKYARIKGVDLLGTGDFSQPDWRKHISETLTEDGTGLLRTKTGFPFALSTEYSLIYSQEGKGRRVHLVLLAPSIEVADQITEQMKTHGRVDYDGRPIFGISCMQFTEEMMSISKDIEIIPAHIWTPWFSMFGSNSGFQSIKECFGDQLKHIHSIETGMSSDPAMNWRLSQLDKFQILSFSDSHSYWPWRIGREAVIFDIKPEYKEMINAIRTGKGIAETIEVDPNYGKYHFDGHRNCGIVFSPEESLAHKNICPVCKKPLTIGVMQRVEELADPDRPAGFNPGNRPGFRSLVPLHDIISIMLGKGIATKSTWQEYYKILAAGKSENDILLNVPREKLISVTNAKIADAIMLNREGRIKVKPGFDGVYGVPIIEGAGPAEYALKEQAEAACEAKDESAKASKRRGRPKKEEIKEGSSSEPVKQKTFAKQGAQKGLGDFL